MKIALQVDVEQEGARIDQLIAERVPEFSRAVARRLLEQGEILVAGRQVKPSYRVRNGDCIVGAIPPPRELDSVRAEDIPLTFVYEDEDLLVVDKPAGLVVHPAAGNWSGTLVNALLFHCKKLSGIGGVRRPGIVHRLDKDTSGLLVVAKNDAAHQGLASQFKAHSIDREYLALVHGRPRDDRGSMDAPIGRHPSERKKFSTRASQAREARTHWNVEERFAQHSLLRVRLETGRTHQIRVHLSAAHWPVVADPVYGGARALGMKRQALHACVLGFEHPRTHQAQRFESPLPDDFSDALRALRE